MKIKSHTSSKSHIPNFWTDLSKSNLENKEAEIMNNEDQVSHFF